MIISVSQLTQAIKGQLEQRFNYVQVKGEISNIKYQSSGHVYFTLKDANSQISAVLFRGNAAKLKRQPKDGDEVICTGEISVYAPRGAYQIIVRTVEYSGVGDLLLKFQELKERLGREGLFEHKKPLPPFPKTIGVVTSPTGAVIQDILNVLHRRAKNFHLILHPVKVQGSGAAEDIAQAIQYFNRHQLCDVMIVGRGGGSLEDLWPFNEECVARAVHASTIPIISAVGHETDVSLCDFAADVRAPTPSAAAEIVTHSQDALLEKLCHAKKFLQSHLLQAVQQHRLRLNALMQHPIIADPYTLIGTLAQKLDEIGPQITRSLMQTQVIKKREMLTPLTTQIRLKMHAMTEIKIRQEKLKGLIAHLNAIDPKNLLQKGYSIAFHQKNNSVIMSASALQPKDRIRLVFADGETTTEVL